MRREVKRAYIRLRSSWQRAHRWKRPLHKGRGRVLNRTLDVGWHERCHAEEQECEAVQEPRGGDRACTVPEVVRNMNHRGVT